MSSEISSMTLPRIFHERAGHNLGGSGSMYLCIFGLVSVVKRKTIICLKNQQNYNSH